MRRFLAALCSYWMAFTPLMAKDVNTPITDDDLNFWSKPGGTPTLSTRIKGDTGKFQVDEIQELTPDAGVTIDGTLIKDGDISGNADTVTNGVYTTGDQSIDGAKSFTLGISTPTLNTGQGAYELYDMDQNVTQASTPTFAGANIGDVSNTELQYLNNASSEIQSQLNGKQPNIATSVDHRLTRYNGTSNVQGTGITVDDSNNMTGVANLGITTINTNVSSTEIGYLDNVTGAIQSQLNGKQPSIATSADNRLTKYNGTDNVQGTGITVDDSNNISGVSNIAASTFNTSISSTELGYLDNVTGAIQSQLNGKQPSIATSADNRLTKYNGTDNVQGTGITVDDSNNISGVGTVTANQVTTPTVTYGTTAGVQVKGRTNGSVASGYIGESYISTQTTGTASVSTDYAPFTFDLPDGVWWVSTACKVIDMGGSGISGLAVNVNQFALFVGLQSGIFTPAVNRQFGNVAQSIVVTGSAIVIPHVWISGTFQNGTDVLECRVSAVRAG